jgi:hypothetical protein
MNQSVIAIPFVITFVYALTLPNVYNNVMGDNNSDSYISQGIFLTNAIPTTTTAVQQDRESDENEPITDLPVIDTPCKSPCPPSAEMCIYMCK